jgi:two-component system LytT family response regulator
VISGLTEESFMKLTTLIVDDESAGREILADMLQRHCPEIEVAGIAASVAVARQEVERLKPDVVFLDIEMPRENGFDFLNSLPYRSFFTVFTTAYSHYALQAIKASAIDYLLKPIGINDLTSAVTRLLSLYNSPRQHHSEYRRGLDVLAGNLEAGSTITRLNLPHAKGFKVVDIRDLVHLSADSNYTVVHLSGRQNMVVSIPLKEFEDILAGLPFFRTHKSHIINLDYLMEYTTDDGGYVILKDGSRVEISKRRLAEFLQYMDVLNRRVRK